MVTPSAQRRLPGSIPRPGQTFAGKYVVERIIGQGGMGTVLAAHHPMLDHFVAVKILSGDISADPDLARRFLLEARAAARIKSEHAVRVSDVDRLDDGTLFLVMEYLEGCDLAQRVETDGPMSVSEVADATLQATEALAHAHARGIVHRDIKPSNLFATTGADGSSVIKVLDFGISKTRINRKGERVDTETDNRWLLGSPGYMSPEQTRDPSSVDARADIWSLGVVMYELLTALPPWDVPNVGALFAAALMDDVVPLRERRPEIPVELEAIVARCMERDRERRFRDVGELARALVPFASQRWNKLADQVVHTLLSISQVEGRRASHEIDAALDVEREAGTVRGIGPSPRNDGPNDIAPKRRRPIASEVVAPPPGLPVPSPANTHDASRRDLTWWIVVGAIVIAAGAGFASWRPPRTVEDEPRPATNARSTTSDIAPTPTVVAGTPPTSSSGGVAAAPMDTTASSKNTGETNKAGKNVDDKSKGDGRAGPKIASNPQASPSPAATSIPGATIPVAWPSASASAATGGTPSASAATRPKILVSPD